jgi:hypothetical protein
MHKLRHTKDTVDAEVQDIRICTSNWIFNRFALPPGAAEHIQVK